MYVSVANLDTYRRIWTPRPVNPRHPLNINRRAWWLTLPHLAGGRFFYDLMGLVPGTLTSFGANDGWRGSTRPGGWAHLYTNSVAGYIPTSWNIAGSPSQISYAAWINPASLTLTGSNSAFGIIGNRTATTGTHALAVGLTSGANLTFIVGGGTNVSTSGVTIAVNAWRRVVATLNGRALVLYVDGQSYASTNLSVDPIFGQNYQLFGDGQMATKNGFYGAIDDVSIWVNRTLTASDVAMDYELSRRGYPGVINRWGANQQGSAAAAAVDVPWHLFRRVA